MLQKAFNMLQKVCAINWMLAGKNKQEQGYKNKCWESSYPWRCALWSLYWAQDQALVCFKLSPLALLQAWFSKELIPRQVKQKASICAKVSIGKAFHKHLLPLLPLGSLYFPFNTAWDLLILRTWREHVWLSVFWLEIQLMFKSFYSEGFYCIKSIL